MAHNKPTLVLSTKRPVILIITLTDTLTLTLILILILIPILIPILIAMRRTTDDLQQAAPQSSETVESTHST